MKVELLPIDGALVFHPDVFRDDRGYFKEVFSKERYVAAGVPETFIQDNVSLSRAGVLRGLHGDARMAKLVQVLHGRAFDVIVDLRWKSPTYKRWHSIELRAHEHTQIYIPAGCLHGFLALEDDTMLLYKQSALYAPGSEIGVAWNDPDIGVEWAFDNRDILLSSKDAANPTLRELGYP